MIVAMRRSIRVGPRAGSPLEEFGVQPDVLHFMTKRDLLADNVDLVARAARLIRQQPAFQLALTPTKGGSGIVASAASKVPPSKKNRMIARLDVYVDGRPVRAIDAVNGTVPPTEMAVTKGARARTIVEAQARDRAGRLVAVRRMSVR